METETYARLACTSFGDYYPCKRVLSAADIALWHRNVFSIRALQSCAHGYEYGYYPCTPLTTCDNDTCAFDVHDDNYRPAPGEIMTRDMHGDILCASCVVDFAGDATHDDDDYTVVYYVAYQGNGEISDGDTVRCDHCGAVIVGNDD